MARGAPTTAASDVARRRRTRPANEAISKDAKLKKRDAKANAADAIKLRASAITGQAAGQATSAFVARDATGATPLHVAAAAGRHAAVAWLLHRGDVKRAIETPLARSALDERENGSTALWVRETETERQRQRDRDSEPETEKER